MRDVVVRFRIPPRERSSLHLSQVYRLLDELDKIATVTFSGEAIEGYNFTVSDINNLEWTSFLLTNAARFENLNIPNIVVNDSAFDKN